MGLRFYRVLGILIIFGFVGCTSVSKEGGAKTGAPERFDAVINAELSGKFFAHGPELYYHIAFKVYDGNVLLVGRLPTQEMKDYALEKARDTLGVKNIIDVLTVGESRSFGDYMDDQRIASQAALGILADGNTVSRHYKLEVMDGVVYIIGESEDDKERQDVIEMLRKIAGVKKVVSYITISSNK